MLFMALALFGVAIILLIGEALWQLKITKGEIARKFVHIFTSIFSATWVFFMPNQDIILVALILVAGVIVVNHYKIFPSIHSIKRVSYGEIWFPLGIGISALIFTNPHVYALAVLHMGLADGLAAVVGVSMGQKAGVFRVLGMKKSVAGSLAFFVVSLACFVTYWGAFSSILYFQESLTDLLLISMFSAIITTITEMISPKGSDNIVVPIVAGVLAVLPSIQFIL